LTREKTRRAAQKDYLPEMNSLQLDLRKLKKNNLQFAAYGGETKHR
jgi:hypothetical protein